MGQGNKLVVPEQLTEGLENKRNLDLMKYLLTRYM